MKAMILAAGLGTRLAPITNNIPKSLVPVNGKPILLKQIENLFFSEIYDITIISGHKSDILEKVVQAIYPDVRIIQSENFASTNNMYSAYLAKEAMGDEGFIMMNADVFFDASVIAELISFPYPDAIVTEIGTYLEESMKVVEENGRLIKISKDVSPKDALGSSIDVYKFSKDGAQAFFNKCHEYIEERKQLKLWSEVALNDILSVIEFKACPLVGRWFEIDNHEDLKAAEELFAD